MFSSASWFAGLLFVQGLALTLAQAPLPVDGQWHSFVTNGPTINNGVLDVTVPPLPAGINYIVDVVKLGNAQDGLELVVDGFNLTGSTETFFGIGAWPTNFPAISATNDPDTQFPYQGTSRLLAPTNATTNLRIEAFSNGSGVVAKDFAMRIRPVLMAGSAQAVRVNGVNVEGTVGPDGIVTLAPGQTIPVTVNGQLLSIVVGAGGIFAPLNNVNPAPGQGVPVTVNTLPAVIVADPNGLIPFTCNTGVAPGNNIPAIINSESVTLSVGPSGVAQGNMDYPLPGKTIEALINGVPTPLTDLANGTLAGSVPYPVPGSELTLPLNGVNYTFNIGPDGSVVAAGLPLMPRSTIDAVVNGQLEAIEVDDNGFPVCPQQEHKPKKHEDKTTYGQKYQPKGHKQEKQMHEHKQDKKNQGYEHDWMTSWEGVPRQ